MKPIITAFKQSPDRGRGLARDMRVRWAFEELGQSYDVQLVTFREMKEPPYRKLQPFGQIPAYQEEDLVLFESGAILLHMAEKYTGLLPKDKNARARAITWLFAALNTVEPPIVERSFLYLFEREKPWYQERLAIIDERVRVRLKDLAIYLGNSDWLENEFSLGDLMMVSVLQRLDGTGLLDEFSNLCAYIKRAEARPAYARAFEAQLEVYRASQSAR